MDVVKDGNMLGMIDLVGLMGLSVYCKNRLDELSTKIDLQLKSDGNDRITGADKILTDVSSMKFTMNEILNNLELWKSAGISLEKRVASLEKEVKNMRSFSSPSQPITQSRVPTRPTIPSTNNDDDVEDMIKAING